MDHHTVAAVSITGTCLDVLGSLYLAYDLLGGQHGPLRLITRAVTYSLVFGIGYGLGLGLFFGLTAGIATGITLAIEFNRAARGLDHYSSPWEAVFSSIRGVGYGAGLYRIVGLRYAIAFGILVTVGQVIAYARGMRPAIDYTANRRPRLSRRQFWGTVVRSVGFMATALVCSFFDFSHHVDYAWWFAIRVGLVIGIVTGVGTTVNPYIEYYADSLPERRLGVFGIGLILCGFALQSFQYWLQLFDVHLT
jgi:CDP-diglyceride synthetase